MNLEKCNIHITVEYSLENEMTSEISAPEIKIVAGAVLGIYFSKWNDCNLCLY